MQLGSPWAKGHTEEIDPDGTGASPETCHMSALRVIHGIDWITGAGHRSHLNGHTSVTIQREQVDLTTLHFDVPRRDPQTLLSQPPTRQSLPRLT
jgi:hypothetical protein